MPTTIKRVAGVWTISSPTAAPPGAPRPAPLARPLSAVDTRADVEALIREELQLIGRELVSTALRSFSWTADGWQPDTLGASLRAARKRAGLTGEQVAARLGIPGSNWRAYEADDVEPTAGRLYEIADALGTTSDALRPFTAAPAADSSAGRRAKPRPKSTAARPRRTSGTAAR